MSVTPKVKSLMYKTKWECKFIGSHRCGSEDKLVFSLGLQRHWRRVVWGHRCQRVLQRGRCKVQSAQLAFACKWVRTCWGANSLHKCDVEGFLLCLCVSLSHCINQILESISHIHQHDIVHRDLKVSYLVWEGLFCRSDVTFAFI